MGTWTLEQWKSKARALEDNAEIMNMRTNLPRTGRTDWSKPPHTMNFKKDPNAMEVDAVKFPPRPYTKNGNNSTNRQLPGNKRQCYNCGKFGHFRRECRTPKKSFQRPQQQQQRKNPTFPTPHTHVKELSSVTPDSTANTDEDDEIATTPPNLQERSPQDFPQSTK